MNTEPICKVSKEDIEAYKRDGVVCIRKVCDQDWVDYLLEASVRVLRNRSDYHLIPTLMNPAHMARTMSEFRKFVFESPMAEVCGHVLESKEIRFYFDEVFSKEPGSTKKTIWHCDRAGWPVSGQMIPSCWMPLTPIDQRTSLEVIAGSHREDILYWLFSPNSLKMIQPDDRPSHPDGEARRLLPETRILSWDMDPGDMLVIHPWALHYSSGNPTENWRFAISTRVLGDDIRWDPRPDCLNFPGVSFDEMIAGQKPKGKFFPLLWSEDGRRDESYTYPRGFATEWPKSVYESAANSVYPQEGLEKIQRDRSKEIERQTERHLS